MSHLKPNDTLENHYRVESFLDKGGMAEIYVVIDTRLDIRLALKIISSTIDITPKYKKMFRSEAKRHAQLLHEGIPQIKDFFIHDNQFCIVMEYVEGIDFERMLKTASEPFKVETVLDWADQILDTLEYIHSANVVHRDIKPSNFKITRRNRIKLLDFGIAHGTIGEMTEVDTRTVVAASPPYASIEQGVQMREWENTLSAISEAHRQKVEESKKLKTHPTQDIFSLGATLYHLLTKKLPVQANHRAIAVWSDRPDTLIPLRELNSDVPPEIAEVIMNALALEREKRPASANRMRELLRQARREIEQKAERQLFSERLADEIRKLNQNWTEQVAELRQASEEKLFQAQKTLEEKQNEFDVLKTERATLIAELERSLKKIMNQAQTDSKEKQSEINAVNDNWLKQVAELRRKSEEKADETQKHLDHLQSELEKQAGVTVKVRREVEAEKQRADKAETELAANNNASSTVSELLSKALKDLGETQKENIILKQQFKNKPDRFRSGLLAGLFGMGIVSALGGFAGYQTLVKPVQVSDYSANKSARTPPTALPTATRTVTPTPTPVIDIPEINGRVASMYLYEGGTDTNLNSIPLNRFVKSKTRYVFFNVIITHDKLFADKDIKLMHQWFRKGKLLESYEETVKIESGDESTEFGYGYGSNSYGNLSAGEYEVAILYNNKKIISEKFEIISK